MNYYQQGDLLFFAGASWPTDAKLKKDGVILHSDTTGHTHRVKNGDLLTHDGKTFISTSEMAVLTHEEHKDLFLPPGNYEMRIVNEYDHMEEEARKVID